MGPSRAHIQLVFVKNSVFKIDENFTWALKISGICLYLNFPMLWSVLFYLQWIFRDLLSSSQSLTFNLIQIHNLIWNNALKSLYTCIFLKLPANESKCWFSSMHSWQKLYLIIADHYSSNQFDCFSKGFVTSCLFIYRWE